jgi:2-phosphoglycerate kinase
MKTYVTNERENTRIPFLRGILIRTLQEAGLPVGDAFNLAFDIRNELADVTDISSDDLRAMVVRHLQQGNHVQVVEQYCLPMTMPLRIGVYTRSEDVSAFSRGRHQRYLQAAGCKPGRAERMTTSIFDVLLLAGVERISTCELGYMTYLCLLQEGSKKAARNYLVWSEFQSSERPLLILVGGAVGSGKSTIASELAHQLDIVRTQSTDMLREVMRMMIPERLLPVLHISSFRAWEALPIEDTEERDADQVVAEGYRSQAELLAVPCEAVLQRAVRESVPLILEGVHVNPGIIDLVPKNSEAITVFATLAVLHSSELKSRLRGRGSRIPHRRAERYLKHFDSIWRLQSYLLSEADRSDVSIIANEDKEKTIHQLTGAIIDELRRHFSGSPAEVFGPVVERMKSASVEKDWRRIALELSG